MAKDPEELFEDFERRVNGWGRVWGALNKLVKFPGLHRKAVGLLIERKTLRLDYGLELFFPERNFSMNYNHNGEIVYFSRSEEFREWLTLVRKQYLSRDTFGKKIDVKVRYKGRIKYFIVPKGFEVRAH
ncbi:MAG: hypothetical protein KKF56_05510 [Nanoarchaeota archaeon]|nr:hypothetical protein [Nanoarchaeota archaeon]